VKGFSSSNAIALWFRNKTAEVLSPALCYVHYCAKRGRGISLVDAERLVPPSGVTWIPACRTKRCPSSPLPPLPSPPRGREQNRKTARALFAFPSVSTIKDSVLCGQMLSVRYCRECVGCLERRSSHYLYTHTDALVSPIRARSNDARV